MTATGSTPAFPLPCLIADIGGTNARFALVEEGRSGFGTVSRVATAAYPSVEAGIEASILAGKAPRPRSAILALAAPIEGPTVHLTNAEWIIDPRALIEQIGVSEVVLLNDFEALSLSLPALGANDVEPIGDGVAMAGRTKLVVGPGTGLGTAALIPVGDSWLPVPGEGGHTDFGPRTPRDEAIWRHLAPDGMRIEAEGLISGPGLVRLYSAVAHAAGEEPRLARAADIDHAAQAGTEPHAVEALALFATYLGRYAGNLALVYLPRGGVYLAGGISLKLASYLKTSAFREAFVDKAPHRRLMEGMATVVITNESPALAGLEALVRMPGRYLLDLSGRVWR